METKSYLNSIYSLIPEKHAPFQLPNLRYLAEEYKKFTQIVNTKGYILNSNNHMDILKFPYSLIYNENTKKITIYVYFLVIRDKRKLHIYHLLLKNLPFTNGIKKFTKALLQEEKYLILTHNRQAFRELTFNNITIYVNIQMVMYIVHCSISTEILLTRVC